MTPFAPHVASALAACLLTGAAIASPTPTPTPARDDSALDYAFRFASAIEADPNDRAKAQQIVLMDLAANGDIDRALSWAETVDGWRRGALYASLAAELARSGRESDARAALRRAERLADATRGWESKRIQAHVAEARAALGDLDASRRLADDLIAGDPRQYQGRAAAAVAAAMAARGDVAGALEHLSRLESDGDLDVAWWRTAGHVALAERTGLSRKDRLRAAAAARDAADDIPTWRRIEALEQIADLYLGMGERDEAQDALEAADRVLAGFGFEAPVKAPLTARVAGAWARLGAVDHAKALLDEAVPTVENQLVIDRPGIYAAIATAYGRAGRDDDARANYDRALTSAEGLVNSRPRALAAVAICRSMGERGVGLSGATRGRLDTLYSGLGSPW